MTPATAPPACAHALYRCVVMHARPQAPRYRFNYQLFYLLLDIDALDTADRTMRWFSHNRFNLVSFRDCDHGHGTPGQLRNWAQAALLRGGISDEAGRIRLLTLPRLFGFAFNPVSFWFCDDAQGRPLAVIAEVNNTFGERHAYVLASDHGHAAYSQQGRKDKIFHVSPFQPLSGEYRFCVEAPALHLRIRIELYRDRVLALDTSLSGNQAPLNDITLLRQAARAPLMTLKVVAAIHWQALKIWIRGSRYYPKPAPPPDEIS